MIPDTRYLLKRSRPGFKLYSGRRMCSITTVIKESFGQSVTDRTDQSIFEPLLRLKLVDLSRDIASPAQIC